MHDHHETEGLSRRELAGLIAANLIVVAVLVVVALNAPDLLLSLMR